MQIMLLENVKNLGVFGSVVNVARGFARNFLFPQGKAVPASAANLADFELRKAHWQEKADDKLATAQKRAEAISGLELVCQAKVSDEGRLYGSISTTDIAKAFKEKGMEVRRQEIYLAEPIRALGDFDIQVHLYSDVNATVKLHVIAK